jgi:hypothetical protein
LHTLERIAKGFGLSIHELLAPAPLRRIHAGKPPGASKTKPTAKKRPRKEKR